MFVCRELYKWWAQYLHSQGDLASAVNYYDKANDVLALAKIYCGLNKVAKVKESVMLAFISHISVCNISTVSADLC